ncbi:MAG TPA: GMC family oxidoreductase [Chloroflexia bacterium]|nr:GMC family oxidoreductase [Chloroflexia bacterium]
MTHTGFYLSARHRRVLRALIPIVCGPGAARLGLVEPTVRHVEVTLASFGAGQRTAFLAGLSAFELLAVLRPPFGRTFSRLPLRARARYFHDWWSSRQTLFRTVARVLKRLIVLGYYEQSAVHRRLKYYPQQWIEQTARRRLQVWSTDIARHEQLLLAPDPLVPAPVRPANRAATRVHTNRDFRGGQLDCDVVVVGSGAGGGVVAAELGEAGLDVIVLEEGGYHRSEEFTAEATAMARMLYRDGGGQVTIGTPSISYAEGRCVGGSTTVNGGMCWRTPEQVLERWAREERVEAILPGQMERYFERVERFVSAAPQDPGTASRDQEILREGAERQGWRVVPNIRNQVHCGGCNNCAFGCPTGAKRSTLVSYIPRAMSFGVEVFADCRVERVTMRGKRAVGVSGYVVSEDGRRSSPFEVRAKRVVLAASAIQTPALLLRSGVRSPSGRIGRNLTLHPSSVVIALFDEAVEGWKGVHQAYQVRQFQDEGLIMAAVNLPPGLLAMAAGRYGRGLAEVMGQYNNIVSAGVLVEDTGAGRVSLLPNGQPIALYDLAERDAHTVVRGTALLSELLFAAGARRVIVPFEGVPDLLSPDDAIRLRGMKIAPRDMDLSTVHVMGTARMGGDPVRHVCDSYGRVYDTEGLYVADASLFPSPIGINPMETIMALATRNAERILEGWKP